MQLGRYVKESELVSKLHFFCNISLNFFSLATDTSSVAPTQSTGHHTMEFFEMCAALITQLAR